MDNKYEIISPPYSIRFQELDRKQALEYFHWFQQNIPLRIIILSNYIQSFDDYKDWKDDFSILSLDRLGKWFSEHITTRKRSKLEIENIYNSAPSWFKNIDIPDFDLSIETMSLIIDIAMYLSATMINSLENLHWEMVKKPKNDKNYQQPVLVGKNILVFNPVHIVQTYAYGVIRGTKKPNRLVELYTIWFNTLNE